MTVLNKTPRWDVFYGTDGIPRIVRAFENEGMTFTQAKEIILMYYRDQIMHISLMEEPKG